MKFIGIFGAALALLLPVPACHAQSAVESLSALLDQPRTSAAPGPAYTLDEIEHIALAENPEVHLAARRVAQAEAQVGGAGALDDPQLMVRSWGVPLKQPWDYNSAQNMFMIGQALPGRGKRDLRTASARSDVTIANDELAATRLRVRVEVRKAFYDLLTVQEELRIHDEHLGIARQAIEGARIKYTVGKTPQAEVLKAQLALARLAEHMIRFERDAAVAKSRLNTLLGRDPGTAIQVRGEYNAAQPLPALDLLLAKAMLARPDLMEASAAVDKARTDQGLAKKTYTPDFNLAAGYMLMPSNQSPRNNYMVEGSMTLPWLNRRKHESELAEASAAVLEKQAELDSMRNAARGQIEEALSETEAAQQLAHVYQDSLRPQSENTLHAAVVAYENDQTSFLDLLDSQMAVIDIDLGWIDAVSEFNNRLAELEMAVGTPIDPGPLTGEEEKK